METEALRRARRRALHVVLGYALIGGVWVVLSSLLLGSLSIGTLDHAVVESLKGVAFVFVTASGLALILRRDYATMVDAKVQLAASATALSRLQGNASLALATGAISHDMKNLLAVVQTNVELLLEDRNADADIVGDIRDGMRRLRDFATQLMARASRQSVFPIQAVELGAVVAKCVRLTNLFAPGHEVSFEVRVADGCTVRARAQELECAILNLLLNAVDANDRRGQVQVSVARRDGTVVLAVRDEGPGVPEDVQAKLFHPHFTTKGERGNGMGLAVTNGIMASYGGTARLADPGPPGAEFVLELPVV